MPSSPSSKPKTGKATIAALNPLVQWRINLSHRIKTVISSWKKLTFEIIKGHEPTEERVMRWEEACKQMAEMMFGRMDEYRNSHRFSEFGNKKKLGCFTSTYRGGYRVVSCRLEGQSFSDNRFTLEASLYRRLVFEPSPRYELTLISFRTQGGILGLSKGLDCRDRQEEWYNATLKQNKWRIKERR